MLWASALGFTAEQINAEQCSRGKGSVLQISVYYNAVLVAVQYKTVHSSAVQNPVMCAVLGPVNYWPQQPGLGNRGGFNSILRWGTEQEQKQEQKQKQEQVKEPKGVQEKEQKQRQGR